MTSPDLIESVARAIYKALSVQGQSISIYKFEAGDTWIDGEFDLSLVARAAIEAVLRRMMDEGWEREDIKEWAHHHAIDLKEKG